MDLQATEIRFAQQLAANEKKIRDKSLKKLRKYLQAKSASKKSGFTHEDFQRIWKGLHYCMWMQDKPLIQEELASKISELVHDLANADSKRLFIRVFIETEAREWNGIDVWRLDKFMMLMRCMFNEALMVLKQQNWKRKSVDGMMTVFGETLLNSNEDLVPSGMRSHFIDIYLDELHSVGGSKINTSLFLQLIDPFIKFLQHTKNSDSVSKVVSKIFDPIIERTARLQHNKGKKQNTTGGSIAFPDLQIDGTVIADYLFELGKEESTTNQRRETFYSIVKRLQNASEGIIPAKPELSKEHPIPKAMIGDAVSSLVQLDLELNDKPSKKQLKADKKKRKALLKVEGKENTIDVLSAPMDSLNEEPTSASKKRKHDQTDDGEDEPTNKMKRKSTDQSDVSGAKKTVKGVLKANRAGVSTDNENAAQKVATESEGSEEIGKKTPKSNKGKKGKKALKDETVEEPVLAEKSTDNQPVNSLKAEKIGKKEKKALKKKLLQGKSQDINGVSAGREVMVEEVGQVDKGTPKKGNKNTAQKRKAEVDSGSDVNGADKAGDDQQIKSGTDINKNSKQEPETITANCFPPVKIQIKPSEDLEEGETEIFVPSKKFKGRVEMGSSKFANFDTLKTPVAYVKRIMAAKNNKNTQSTPVYIKKRMETPASTNSATGSARRVSFNMRKNQCQSFKDSLKSPIVPFNPARTPDSSILKAKCDSVSSQGSVLRKSGRKQSAETPPSSGNLKSLKSTKRTPKGTPKPGKINTNTPKMAVPAKLKRKVASDFFAL